MRHVITILFSLSLTVPFLSVFSWLSIEKKAVRKEMKHQIMEVTSNDELISFTFEQKDTLKVLKWKHSKEFEYKGEMYDIVRREYENNHVTYYLWWDHEETALNGKLDKLTAALFDQSPSKERSSQQLSFFLTHLFVEESDLFSINLQLKDQNQFYHYSSHYTGFNPGPTCPPPKDLRIL